MPGAPTLTAPMPEADADITPHRPVLFTAFEPSGDDHAAPVIAELKRRRPDLPIYAWGGPKMERAGAIVVERTGDDAVMGMPGLAKIREHKQINERIARWMDEHKPILHVPVDSPGANFPICALAKARSCRVVHLVAPQVWAWATWRIKKLRKRTDHVLCLLPFEEEWFRARGVDATFIGHPLFEEPVDEAALDEAIADWPSGAPRVALMPGSRPSEMRKNFPLLVGAYRRLEREHEAIAGVVAATRPEVEAELRRLGAPWPKTLRIETGKTDQVIRWCDLALVVSGTVTLQIAKQRRPMVIVYKFSRLISLPLRFVVKTRLFSLPNLIAGRKIVPELIPHFGTAEPIADEAITLLEDTSAADEQRTELARVTDRFAGRQASELAADRIEMFLPDRPAEHRAPSPERVAG